MKEWQRRASVGWAVPTGLLVMQWWAKPTLRNAQQRGFHSGSKSAERSKRGGDGARLIATVDHAVAAFGIAALVAVSGPVGRFHQLAEGFAVAFTKQITRALPAKDAVRRAAPRRAFQIVVAAEKFEEQRRLVESPASLGAIQNRAKQFRRLFSCQKMVLVRGFFIAVAGRDRHPLDAECHHLIEELTHPRGISAAE